MSKKDEALKLALETSEGIVNADWRKWDELASSAEFERWAKSRANFMATILREALAEQHEMTNIERHERNVKKFLAEQPAQQKPVTRVNLDMTGAMATLPKTGSQSVVEYKPVISDVGADTNIVGLPGTYYGIVPKGTGKITLHESKPPQRTWIGLTDEEVHALWMTGEANIAEEQHSVVAYEIEAKLKEKNT